MDWQIIDNKRTRLRALERENDRLRERVAELAGALAWIENRGHEENYTREDLELELGNVVIAARAALASKET